MNRIIQTINILALATGVAWGTPIATAYSVGDTVADFTIPDADGDLVSLSDFSGSVVMINFWTSG